MGIFSGDESEIDRIFASVLRITEAELYSRFRDGYKAGRRSGDSSLLSIYQSSKRIGLGSFATSFAFLNPHSLGYLTGGCVRILLDGETYSNSLNVTLLLDIIFFLKGIPGFDMNVIKKRAKRIDASKFTPQAIANLKRVLSNLS